MSTRISGKPVEIPKGVEVQASGNVVKVKGAKGELGQPLPHGISIEIQDNQVLVKSKPQMANGNALAGTIRALVNNSVIGVSEGFVKKLQLVGVGYRAQLAGQKLNLTLGLSHPVSFDIPKGITIEVPQATEVVVSGIDKQLVGQVAADIRGICGGVRKPEPYKGKGIRYVGEVIILKETKKK